MRTRLLPLLTVVLAAAAPVVLGAAVTVKLATQAPVNSSWHKALLDMGAQWEAKTAGRVKLTVYAGGTQGSEDATIRMMRPGVDQLQANLLMLPGLSTIDDGFNVFGIPFFFQSDAEGQHVLEKLTPMLEKRLEAKGFKLIAWGSAGWVQLFSKKPLATLADIKAAKLFTSQGDDKMTQWYKANGFRPVALNASDIPAQLKLSTGMIDAAPSPPYPALLLQIFRDAKYMLDVHVAPLYGAVVMTNEAWGKVEAQDRAAVDAAADALQTRILGEAPKLDADSVATMKSRGLTVTSLDPKTGYVQYTPIPFKLQPDMGGEYTNAVTDQRHRATLNGVWELPLDFQLSGLYFYGSGMRLAVAYSGDTRNMGSGGSNRYNPATGIIAPRNSFVGQPLHRVDMRLLRHFSFGNRITFDGIVEVFNVFNHVNYGNYVTTLGASNFGAPVAQDNVAYRPRQAQLGFRATF